MSKYHVIKKQLDTFYNYKPQRKLKYGLCPRCKLNPLFPVSLKTLYCSACSYTETKSL